MAFHMIPYNHDDTSDIYEGGGGVQSQIKKKIDQNIFS